MVIIHQYIMFRDRGLLKSPNTSNSSKTCTTNNFQKGKHRVERGDLGKRSGQQKAAMLGIQRTIGWDWQEKQR